jgi:erythromycin esterase
LRKTGLAKIMKSDTLKNFKSYPLVNSKDLDPLLERIGDASHVFLGEASHGTHEYYTWRSAISQRLIEEKGFNFIAVEGDWPDCYRVNRYIKGFDDTDKVPQEVLKKFNRWPTWMWANWEVVALVSWLKDYNKKRVGEKKVGFYGLDVYSLWESMEALISYLKKNDPNAAGIAQRALDCFSASGKDEQQYAVRSLSDSCKNEVVKLLKELRLRVVNYNHDPEAALNTIQNAHIAVEAEKYYRNMISFDEETWNIRDRHMMDTLLRIIEFHGNAKTIVWEHNTHIGDARYTNMKNGGLLNIGQLARERFTEGETVLVGFGSYMGKVIAGSAWGAPMQEMEVPEARASSFEERLHADSSHNRILIFDRHDKEFEAHALHRAIGVVYNPAHETGNYVPSTMNKRYDAFIYLDETSALHPLHNAVWEKQVPETYPFNY